MVDESLDIYDDNFQYNSRPIGQKDRKSVHGDGDWHKGFHCWIIYRNEAEEGHILLRRRSARKGDEAFTLDITAVGHLTTQETSREGIREIEEELGVQMDFDKLVSLGNIIEIAAYSGIINREFDEVFLLEHKQPLTDYKLPLSEGDGLTDIKVSDGISLFTRKTGAIPATSVRVNEDGVKEPYTHELRITDFGGEDRGNYYIKVFVAADLYFRGYPHLYV